MKATVFGAGNIGRGLVGSVLTDAGYELTYVDADTDLVSMLDEADHFTLVTADSRRDIPIAAAIDAVDEEAVAHSVAQSQLIATAVGQPILAVVAPTIGAGLAARAPGLVNVLACENVHPNSAALAAHVAKTVSPEAVAGVGFPDVVVDRIVPGPGGSLEVYAETDFEFVVDAARWVGPRPAGTHITFAEDIKAYELRKLWLVNGLHAITAWLGIAAGHDHIHTAISDAQVRRHVSSAGASAATALSRLSEEFTSDELEAYVGSVLSRFANPALADPTVRVARNPLAKLEADERILGPALAAERDDLDVTGYAAGIAAALQLGSAPVAGLTDLNDAITEQGWDSLLMSRGAAPDGQLVSVVRSLVQEQQQEGGNSMVSEEVVIDNPAGLHARPAAEIVECAQSAAAKVRIQKGDKVADADSIMSVLALGASTGDTVTVTAEGEDAGAAVASVRAIMQASE